MTVEIRIRSVASSANRHLVSSGAGITRSSAGMNSACGSRRAEIEVKAVMLRDLPSTRKRSWLKQNNLQHIERDLPVFLHSDQAFFRLRIVIVTTIVLPLVHHMFHAMVHMRLLLLLQIILSVVIIGIVRIGRRVGRF